MITETEKSTHNQNSQLLIKKRNGGKTISKPIGINIFLTPIRYHPHFPNNSVLLNLS
jgi:hypothetical protein